MLQRIYVSIGLTGLIAAMSLSLLPRATAQVNQQDQIRPAAIQSNQSNQSNTLIAQSGQTTFQGRGVAQGSAFTRGRNATTSLTIDRDNFGFELAEPLTVRGESSTNRAQVQYRGSIIRQTSGSINSGNFTLDGRIRSFSPNNSLRVRNVTTGTCRIEVFDSRVISSTCNSLDDNSRTQFLGLEQF